MDEVKKELLLIWLLCLAIFAMQFIQINKRQDNEARAQEIRADIAARIDEVQAQCLTHLTTGE